MNNFTMNLNHCDLYYEDPVTGKEERVGMAIGVDLEKEGNDNMNNEILRLYEERREKEIHDDYATKCQEEYSKVEEVKQYEELIDTFNSSLEELVEEYNKESYKPFLKTGYVNTYKYEPSSEIMEEIKKKHIPFRDAELRNLKELVEEVSAQLSLSNDKDYQIEVLKKYEILDSEGKLNV